MTTPTSKPIPSNDVIDLKFNAEKIDEVVNSGVEKYTDRFGIERYTIQGIRKNLAPLGKTYTKDEALAAITSGEIPDGAVYFVWSDDVRSIADKYKNIGGVPTYQEIQYPRTEYVTAAYDHTDDIIQHYPDSAISIPGIAAAVEGDGGIIAPYMSKSGRVGSIDEFGEWQDAAFDNSLTTKYIYNAQDLVLSDGSICRAVLLDEDNRVIEAWTYDGGYYLATTGSDGLIRVSGGPAVNNETAIVYASAVASIAGGTGTRVSANIDDNVCYIFPTWGQSLAQGFNGDASDTLTAVTPLYPDHCLMFAGTRPNRGSTEITSLTPLKEALSAGGLKETAASGLASHTYQMVQTITGHSIRTLSFVAAEGGKAFQDLTKGTPAWQAMIQGIVDAKNICIQNGWKPIVACLDVMAGETDSENINAMTTERYKRQLQQFDADINSEVKRITKQNLNVRIIVCQSAFTPSSRGMWDQPVRMAQYELDGVGNIRLAGPVYPFPYADVIHINSLGQNRRGQMVSRATVWDFFGTGWRPMRLVNYIWRTPTLLSLIFDVMTPPIVMDTSGDTITVDGLGAGMGFVLDDRSSTPIVIASAVVASPSVVDITLSAAPVNPDAVRVGYAIKRNDGNTTQDGPVIGARGCLRDSTNHISLYDSVSNHNWMPAFIKEIPF